LSLKNDVKRVLMLHPSSIQWTCSWYILFTAVMSKLVVWQNSAICYPSWYWLCVSLWLKCLCWTFGPC